MEFYPGENNDGVSDSKMRERFAYKGFTPRMGIYAVRHLPSGRMLLGTSPNLVGALNGHRFRLDAGMHPEKAMLEDWRRDGPDAFAFEILDELDPPEDERKAESDLDELLALWCERLGRRPDQGYSK